MTQRPSIPKGTRDFSPEEMSRRNYIFDTIRGVFALYGFRQIETPAMETLPTLMGKYGEEGDRLLFKILNSGDFLAPVDDEELAGRDALHLASRLCEKGLRYDLTVPFARYVVMHREQLQMPFRRYQIAPVWRADRPQKGRYREFYQCDADIVGSDSLLNEVELMQIVDDVFTKLGVRVTVKINNRKILQGMAETIGEAGRLTDITVAIDKMDKIGRDKVNELLAACGLPARAIDMLQPMIGMSGTNAEKLSTIAGALSGSPTGMRGVEETRYIVDTLEKTGMENSMEVDLTLARGLNYYTGAIFEVKAVDTPIGSITGGGRYDNLTGIFGMPGLSGVGISFGADRIYDVLNALNLYPARTQETTRLLFVNFGDREMAYVLPIARMMRQAGIATELYPDNAKMRKQMAYANAKGIAWVAIAGETEMATGMLTLKNMTTGEQTLIAPDKLAGMVGKA